MKHPLVEPSAHYEDIRIPLRNAVHELDSVSGVLGIPEWWPTGARVAVAMAHGSTGDLNDPVLEVLHRELTENKCLSLRFNFPFAEAGKRSAADSMAVLEHTFRAAVGVLGRLDPDLDHAVFDPDLEAAHGAGRIVGTVTRRRLEGVGVERADHILPVHDAFTETTARVGAGVLEREQIVPRPA